MRRKAHACNVFERRFPFLVLTSLNPISPKRAVALVLSDQTVSPSSPYLRKSRHAFCLANVTVSHFAAVRIISTFSARECSLGSEETVVRQRLSSTQDSLARLRTAS